MVGVLAVVGPGSEGGEAERSEGLDLPETPAQQRHAGEW
jgi:hypothetical protein